MKRYNGTFISTAATIKYSIPCSQNVIFASIYIETTSKNARQYRNFSQSMNGLYKSIKFYFIITIVIAFEPCLVMHISFVVTFFGESKKRNVGFKRSEDKIYIQHLADKLLFLPCFNLHRDNIKNARRYRKFCQSMEEQWFRLQFNVWTAIVFAPQRFSNSMGYIEKYVNLVHVSSVGVQRVVDEFHRISALPRNMFIFEIKYIGVYKVKRLFGATSQLLINVVSNLKWNKRRKIVDKNAQKFMKFLA